MDLERVLTSPWFKETCQYYTETCWFPSPGTGWNSCGGTKYSCHTWFTPDGLTMFFLVMALLVLIHVAWKMCSTMYYVNRYMKRWPHLGYDDAMDLLDSDGNLDDMTSRKLLDREIKFIRWRRTLPVPVTREDALMIYRGLNEEGLRRMRNLQEVELALQQLKGASFRQQCVI